jgi:hypothetical protein
MTKTTYDIDLTPGNSRAMFLETLPADLSGIYFNGQTNFDAYLRTIMFDHIRDEIARLTDGDLNRFRKAFEDILKKPTLWQRLARRIPGARPRQQSLELDEEKFQILYVFQAGTRPLNFGLTKSGFMAMLPHDMRKDDLVTVLFGGRVPFILRRHLTNGNEYFLVGPAYVHGVMDREAKAWLEEGRLKAQEFILV